MTDMPVVTPNLSLSLPLAAVNLKIEIPPPPLRFWGFI